MKRLVLLLLVVAMLAAMTMACQQAAPTDTGQVKEVTRIVKETVVVPASPGASVPEGPKQRYVLLTPEPGFEFWLQMAVGIRDVIDGMGLPVQFDGPVGPPVWDALDELNYMYELIATEPDAIIMTSVDDQTCIPAIEKAVEEGIVVQCLDMRSDTPLCEHCGTDFRDMGIVAANRMVELCQEDLASTGKCLVGLTRAAGAYSQDLRLEGINSVLQDYPGIQVVADVDDQYQPDLTLTAAQQILVANPDLRILHCLHGEGAKAMAQAVRNSGLEPNKDVYVIGNDLGSTTLECMQAGDCDSTVAQDMYMMGAYAFLNAYMKVNQFMDHTLFEGKHSVPLINPGTGLVTQETMGSLLESVREIEDMFR